MSLRRRLVAGLVAVAAVLLVADVALASTFRSYLVGRVDRQVAGVMRSVVDRGRPGGQLLSEYRVLVTDLDGRVVGELVDPFRQRRQPAAAAQVLPAGQITGHAVDPGGPLRYFTADVDGGAWRFAAVRGRIGPAPRIVVVGASLEDTSATLGRMRLVLATATLAVLLTLGLVGAWVHRQGVRPVVAMTATAGAIAAGDLSERVEHTDPRTEAGRLGAALNTMLTRIEGAFAERTAAERRLRRFVADASHELRTPLTSIRGYAELYRTGALDDPERLADAMRRVESEASRMGLLVEDLLLLARLDQGRPLDRGPVRLDEVAGDAVADARAVDPARPVELAAAPVTVTGDDARLRQVAGNLVGNALRHTPPGTPVTVTVTAAGDRAVLEVRDEGPGMDAETAARAFERFYRADPSRAAASGGAGLGLSIVEAVVAAHGGRVALDTAPGAGARFVVELPLTS